MIAIAIVSINKNKYSETFIHNHARLLPAQIHYMYGGYLPKFVSKGFEGNEESLSGVSRLRLYQKIIRKKVRQNERAVLEDGIHEYLKDNKIQAVLVEYGPSGVEMMNVCQEAGVPMIVHFHGYDAYREDMMESHGGRYPEMFRKAAAVIGVSKHMCERLKFLGLPESKLKYNPYGPDSSHFTYHDAGKNPPHFIGVGRFAETKSPHLTLISFERVLREIPEARLTLVGDGILMDACKILAKALGIAGNVEFKGALDHEEVGKVMAGARAFVQHSLTTPSNDCEGTPVAIIEASAAGLPVVATRHAGIPDVILEEETGILVDEYDINGMAEAMIRIARDPGLASRMGKAGHERIKVNFTLQRHIDELWNIIREAAISA